MLIEFEHSRRQHRRRQIGIYIYSDPRAGLRKEPHSRCPGLSLFDKLEIIVGAICHTLRQASLGRSGIMDALPFLPGTRPGIETP